VLCEFRARLLQGGAEQQLLDTLLAICRDRGWLHARGRQRTDSTHVLAVIRAHNRVETVRETLRHALNVLAELAPDWLLEHAESDWAERYGRSWDDDRLPTSQEERDQVAATVGADGAKLLAALYADDTPVELRGVSAIDILRRVWLQNYVPTELGVRWRTTADGLPPAMRFISSPYDLEAHHAVKRNRSWVDYKVHLTETCDADLPNLITHIETTLAPVTDWDATPLIHKALARSTLLPSEHLVDLGYVDADLLVESRRDFEVDLIGPAKPDLHWQAREKTGFASECFTIDWAHEQATCPEGRVSVSWSPLVDNRRTDVIKIWFSAKDCRPCPSRDKCIRSSGERSPRRLLTIRRKAAYEALQAARQRQHTRDFAALYARRSGIEGTVSQAVRTCAIRRTRYRGLKKTHLDHVATAAALNCLRLGEWLADRPRAKTRSSPFGRLLAAAS
jgi:transposase